MIKHVVLFKFIEETTDDQLKELCNEFKLLKGEIPGLVEAQAGINTAQNNKGFRVLLTALFKNKVSLESYLSHSKHREFALLSREIGRLDSIVMDIEV